MFISNFWLKPENDLSRRKNFRVMGPAWPLTNRHHRFFPSIQIQINPVIAAEPLESQVPGTVSLLELLLEAIFELVFVSFDAERHWRVFLGFVVGASAVAGLCFCASSPAVRWIGGFCLFVGIVTLAIVWEKNEEG